MKLVTLQNNQIVVYRNTTYTDQEFSAHYEFYSYGTLIAEYLGSMDNFSKDIINLTKYYDYSKTTSKWLKVFLHDYCDFYYKDKKELDNIISKGGSEHAIVKIID